MKFGTPYLCFQQSSSLHKSAHLSRNVLDIRFKFSEPEENGSHFVVNYIWSQYLGHGSSFPLDTLLSASKPEFPSSVMFHPLQLQQPCPTPTSTLQPAINLANYFESLKRFGVLNAYNNSSPNSLKMPSSSQFKPSLFPVANLSQVTHFPINQSTSEIPTEHKFG